MKRKEMKQTMSSDELNKADKAEKDKAASRGKSHDKKEISKRRQEPASELMKKVAEIVPRKSLIAKDFSPEEAKEILAKVAKNKAQHKDRGIGNGELLETPFLDDINEAEGVSKAEKTKETKGVEKEPSKEEQEKLEKEMRDLIYRTKIIAKRLEVGNKNKVILFPSYSKKSRDLVWYKMGDFSAQYFAYRMADRMGRDVKLRPDGDHFGRMKVIASISNIDKFISQVEKLKEFDRHEETLDRIHIFYLKKGLTDDEVALLRRTEEIRKETMHNVLRPKKAAPKVYLNILMLGRQVMGMTRRMQREEREEIGDDVMKNVVKLMALYFDYTAQFTDADETKVLMQKALYRVRAGMAFLGDMEVIPPARACAIGETVAKTEELIKEEIK